eukprot:9504120-Pyramimonas_sp.AAC.2
MDAAPQVRTAGSCLHRSDRVLKGRDRGSTIYEETMLTECVHTPCGCHHDGEIFPVSRCLEGALLVRHRPVTPRNETTVVVHLSEAPTSPREQGVSRVHGGAVGKNIPREGPAGWPIDPNNRQPSQGPDTIPQAAAPAGAPKGQGTRGDHPRTRRNKTYDGTACLAHVYITYRVATPPARGHAVGPGSSDIATAGYAPPPDGEASTGTCTVLRWPL